MVLGVQPGENQQLQKSDIANSGLYRLMEGQICHISKTQKIDTYVHSKVIYQTRIIVLDLESVKQLGQHHILIYMGIWC